jgi:hypothetical protein
MNGTNFNNAIIWNQDIIALFSEDYFGAFLTKSNLSEEIVIDEIPFWLLSKNKKKYLLDHEDESKLPIIPVDHEMIKYKGKIYHHITQFKPARFKEVKKWEFREFVDIFMNVKHTNQKDFLIYKFFALGSYIERINWRCATEASFGKGGPFLVEGLLRKDVSVINPRSMAAVEFRLTNKIIILDEISNLESSQRALLQEFLLLIGDNKNTYEKSTRGGSSYGTLDSYNVKDLSLGIIYNTLDHYQANGQEGKYFDRIFQKAVMNRFLPIKLSGTIDVEQFSVMEDLTILAKKFKQFYIDYIRSIEYYKNNYIEELKQRSIIKDYKFTWPIPDVNTLLTGRQKVTFNKICRLIALYSKDKEEFIELSNYIKSKITDYYIMLNQGTGTLANSLIQIPSSTAKVVNDDFMDESIEEEIITNESLDSLDDELLEDIESLFKTSDEITNKGYPVDSFINLFGEEILDRLIKKQE